ncbi:unnamed protein product [Calypogeia fissa]
MQASIMLKQRGAIASFRMMKSRERLSSVMVQTSIHGLLFEGFIRFVSAKEGLATKLVSRMSRTSSNFAANKFLRLCGPLQTRNLTTTVCGEQDLSRFGSIEQSTKRSTKESDGRIVVQAKNLMDSTDSGVLIQGYQEKYFRTGSGWPWISVVPSEAVPYIDRGGKGRPVVKEASSPGPEHVKSVKSLLPSDAAFPHIHQDSRLENLLNLHPTTLPVKISTLLSKYGWSAHTILELRTLMATEKKLKPRHVLDVLSRQKDADVAYSFLQWALQEGKCTPHISCFTMVLRLLGRVRKYDHMEKLLEDVDKWGYVLDKIILTAAMRCYAEGQRMQEASELFVKMKEKGVKPDCVTYSVLMQMFSKAKLYQEALNLYEEMLAQGVATDTQVYNLVVSTFGKAGRLDLAYQKLEEMRTRGHIPDQFTYGVLLEGYAKAGRREFMDLYREMKAAGIPVNEVIFHIMFSGIEHIGTLNDAESLFAEMEQVGLSANLNAFSTLIGMCSKIGDAEAAQRWFDRMTAMGLKPTLAVGNSLLDSYARAEQIDRAEQILDSFPKWDLTPTLPTLIMCMRCLCRCKRPEDLKAVQGMLSCHSGGQFLSVLLGNSPEKDLAPVIASFLKSLHRERRLNRREFIDVLIDYLYKSGFRSQAYQVLEGALANYVFPGLVEQGAEGICAVNLSGMERGTAIIALTYTLPRLAKQFHRKEMTPEWVQIYTVPGTEEIPTSNSTSVHQSVQVLLKALHSPFHAGTLQTGGGFVCRGEEVMHWLDEPQIKAMLAFKH